MLCGRWHAFVRPDCIKLAIKKRPGWKQAVNDYLNISKIHGQDVVHNEHTCRSQNNIFKTEQALWPELPSWPPRLRAKCDCFICYFQNKPTTTKLTNDARQKLSTLRRKKYMLCIDSCRSHFITYPHSTQCESWASIKCHARLQSFKPIRLFNFFQRS